MIEPIRIAIAGLGNRAAWAVGAVMHMPQFRLVAVIDSIPQRIDVFANEFKLNDSVSRYTNLADCLSGTNFDALAIFTPDGTHAELVLAALDAGKYVFVEKPLEIEEQRIDRIIRADNAVGGKTFVGFNLRYAPVYVKIRELIRSGTIGQVLTIQADEFYDYGRTYFRRWNRLERMSGGLWITKACHDCDLLYWMAGADPISVYASSSLDYYVPKPEASLYCRDCKLASDCPDRFMLPADGFASRLLEATEKATGNRPDLCLYNSDKDTFDHGTAVVTFANNVIASYTVNVVAGFSVRRMRVSGTRGTIDATSSDGTITILRRDPARVQTVEVETRGMHAGADDHILPTFADFVLGKRPRIVAPTEAATAVRIGLAARQSCQTRQVISLAKQ